MPNRPRSHVIEDLAQAKFTLAVQPGWILRSKDRDYGVDWEAERLGENDSGTGDVFYVQSKATDVEASAQSVQIKTDRLRYLTSFEIPAMIVRYCVPKDTTYWMWANEALGQSKPDAETINIKFGEQHLWNDDTLKEIERTIPVLRAIKRSDPRTTFSLLLPDPMPAKVAISLGRICSRLSTSFHFIDQRSLRGVPIRLAFAEKEVTLSIERLASVKAEIDQDDFDALSNGVYYLLAALLETLDQIPQAAAVATLCLNETRTFLRDDLGAKAAIALLRNGNADEGTDLAILNGLHTSQGFGHTMFRLVLVSPIIPQDSTGEAADRFYNAAISACQLRGEGVGALRYSYANYLASKGRRSNAVAAFNATRKAEPDYWTRSYYLKELGGILFRSARYRASARAYQCAFTSDPTERTRFCLGDAELYAGNLQVSAEAFQPLAELGSSVGAEVRLKLALVKWAKNNGLKTVNDWAQLHSIRAVALPARDIINAFGAQLAITFILEDDIECWADAIFLAAMSGELGLIEDVMLVAAKRTHLEAYSSFKERRQDFLNRDELIAIELDRIALAYNEQVAHEHW
ncbi:DUF4365 domain-containing protein [Rhizobium leguminosarum]|uniref:DUF4365 domain-containing protein n=1 Tax=Rhizobium leguminosarum TaxID=384 RepID=A0A2K9YXA4_RHILE|nr:DUF4365 domain-containing protein [Rhizobium leguminosarum]AUW40616.1 hypothetical protein CUJ84_Chr000197 [Rhizobium leguminosarum]